MGGTPIKFVFNNFFGRNYPGLMKHLAVEFLAIIHECNDLIELVIQRVFDEFSKSRAAKYDDFFHCDLKWQDVRVKGESKERI